MKRNYLQRLIIKQTETYLLLFKTLLTGSNLFKSKIITKYLLKEIMLIIKRYSSRSLTRSLCVLTGRTRGIYRKTFRTTRMQVREKANHGFYTGIKKSSW